MTIHMNSGSYVFRSGEMILEYMNRYSYDKINDSDKLLYYYNNTKKGTACKILSNLNLTNQTKVFIF